MPNDAALSPEAIEAFLRAHPRFLADRPGLYAALDPPLRLHGEALADHMQAMLAAERARLAGLEDELARMLARGRAADGLSARIGRAVLALMATRDAVDCIRHELPALLGLDCCCLAGEAAAHPGLTPLPAGAVARLLGPGREALVRAHPAEAALLYAEQAPLIARDALARIPGAAPMLIALGARNDAALPESLATPHLTFLGQAVAVALAR